MIPVRWKALAALAAALALLAWDQEPEEAGWKILQLTSCSFGQSMSPRVSADGKRVFFISTCDFASKNFDHGPEVFKWEDGKITQFTDTKYCQFLDLDLSPDDQRLAVASDCPFQDKNPGHGIEIAVFDLEGKTTVLGQGLGYPSRHPAWSSDSQYLVFESMSDLAELNPDHSQEIFAADFSATPPAIRQVSRTKTPAKCESPGLAGDAIVARCNDDLPGTRPADAPGPVMIVDGRTVGDNPDHNFEVIAFDLSGKPRQLTSTQTCENFLPTIHPLGRLIALFSECDLAQESKLKTFESKPALYLLNPKVQRPWPDLQFTAAKPAWSGDGRRLVMASSFGRDRMNREHNQEIFIAELAPASGEKGTLQLSRPTAITDFLFGSSQSPDVNRDGTVIVFISNANPFSTNNDGSLEVFMAVKNAEPESEE